MISAPVKSAPQRKPPPLGDVASWLSRKSHWVRRFGFRNLVSMALVRRRARGRRKKGVEVLIAGGLGEFLCLSFSFFAGEGLGLGRRLEGEGLRGKGGKGETTADYDPND